MIFMTATVVIAFLAALILTRLMITYAVRRRLVDVPNERSSHDEPTPRGGGLAIVIMFLVCLIYLLRCSFLSMDECFALIGSGVITAAIGFWDDHGHVSARNRVLAHFLAAAWVLFWLGGFPEVTTGVTFFVGIQNLFWLVALVWFLNVYNFMDGIDGIAGAETVFIAGASGLMLLLGGAHDLAMVAFILVAGTTGFLIWNLPPARIFLGDVGSGFLGIVLGVLAIVSVRHGALSMWVWAILFGVFVVDATVTVGRRILCGACWYEAHRSHAYQHAARRWKSHGKVTRLISVINVFWLFPLALAAWRWPNLGPCFALVGYLPLVYVALLFDAGIDGERELPLPVQELP